MKSFKTVLFICICLAVTKLAHAEAIRQPPSLEAGEQYRLAYVTSWETTADSSDIEFYNRFVQENADAAPIGEWGLEWKAIAGTETVSARENTGTADFDSSVPIFLLDGTRLVAGYEDFWNGEVKIRGKHFDVDEFGVAFDSPDPPILAVWTGSGSNGLRFYYGEFGGPLGDGNDAIIGFGDSPSHSWINSTILDQKLELPMYAMSEVLTAVPEPSSSPFAFGVLLVYLAFVRGMPPSSATC